MAKCFQFAVITAEGTVLSEKAEYCNIPMADGSLGILANHAPMLCAMVKGKIYSRLEDGTEKTILVSPGITRVCDNEVTILCDSAEIQQ